MPYYIYYEMDLVTGAPSGGQVPVLRALDKRLPKRKILQKPDIATVDWDAWKGKLETKDKDVWPLVEASNVTDLREMTEELLNDAQTELMKTKRCFM